MLKRVLSAALVIAFQLFFVQSAMADDKKEKKVEKNTKDHKWWYFAGLPVYDIFVHTQIHEGSHALATVIDPNWEVKRFQPYPHRLKNGAIVLGSTTSSPSIDNAKAWKDTPGLILMAAAPYITDTVAFITSDLLLSTGTIEPATVSGRITYLAGMAIPWWDLLYNFILPAKITDAGNIAIFSGIPRRWVSSAGISLSIVGIWRLVVNYNRVFPSHSKKIQDNKTSLIVLPTVEKETVGISVRTTF